MAKDNLTDCVLWYGDRVQPGDPIVFTAVYMKRYCRICILTIMMQLFRLRMTGYATILELKDPEETRFYYADIWRKISSGMREANLPVSVYPQRRDL